MPSPLISAADLAESLAATVVLDCRFSLADPRAGEASYRRGHIAGAHYLHLERDLSAETSAHGGRHPLPEPARFCERMAQLAVTTETPVVAYDDARFAFAARAWWMLTALGFRGARVLDGGYAGWCAAGGAVETGPEAAAKSDPAPGVSLHRAQGYAGVVDIDGVRAAQAGGATLVDSREEKRYLGREEPIDPVAGHIPGALNYPWQQVSDEAGYAREPAAQRARWEQLEPDREVVVYCGSGVTACVNLLSLALAGREDAKLYAGSWSDWCSYLP